MNAEQLRNLIIVISLAIASLKVLLNVLDVRSSRTALAGSPTIPAAAPMRAVFFVPILSATLPVIGKPTREPQAKAKRRKLSVPVPISSNCFTSGILDSQEANRKPLVAKVARLPLRALSTVLE